LHFVNPLLTGLGYATACVMTSALLLVAGCGEATPKSIDLSKTPWLDPKVQMQGLKNEDFRIRGLSAFNLGNMGAKGADAIAELDKLAAADPNPKVRQNAAEALEKIRAATGQPSD
jgi:hypothetical protein